MNWDELPGHPIALLGISWAKKGNSLWLLTTILQLYFYVKPLVQLLFFSLKKKMRNWWFHGKSLLLLPLLIFDPFIKQARDAQKEQYFFYVSSSNASRYMYGMHNALKMEQITTRKGEHDPWFLPKKPAKNEFWF